MPLDPTQSAPGNRYSGPDGKDYDIIARVATDAGPFLITTAANDNGELLPGALISEGSLRDNEDVAHVGAVADAKAAAAATRQEEEDRQREEDRQARIQATAAATDTTDATDGNENAGQTPPTPTA